jgi:antitoxin component of MazEF toxin-antitoxin module
MTIVKARKQGNSVVITLPAALEVNVGQEFQAIKKIIH